MASENEQRSRIEEGPKSDTVYLQKFKLYETSSNFYMVGRDKNKTFWRVLKIDRTEPTELNIVEDCTTFSKNQRRDLMERLKLGNKSAGGLKFVTTCYGIVGFVKFLGPYYMLLITKRRKIGTICSQPIHAVAKTELIPIPNSTILSRMPKSENENRYKKLLCKVDLTKDFFFSYSYHIMCNLQKNKCEHETRNLLYGNMFVWNEFLTRGIRNRLKNTLWTVALVYGFFEQVKLSISRKDFMLTLIARRSRHYAGTRYLKRGVNERGRVANDVETENIVCEDVVEEIPIRISSVVQNRGSIPLFWSQDTSRINIKPDIILSKKDPTHGATRRHFENLAMRYGNPIIILNLIKTLEKKPRESILLREFENAIDIINRDLLEENRLIYRHLDLDDHFRKKSSNVLKLLGDVAVESLEVTKFFYCQGTSETGNNSDGEIINSENLTTKFSNGISDDVSVNHMVKRKKLQQGVLRTNCIDCLDRTNIAQYAYGLVALGHQLHALGFIDSPNIDPNSPLADDLMRAYERMGDSLAKQYSGSPAHNKIFCEKRGRSKAAIKSQGIFINAQRFFNNAYTDAEKQDAINLFLGRLQPQHGESSFWELDYYQNHNVGSRGLIYKRENSRSSLKRSLSDGNIVGDNISPTEISNAERNKDLNHHLHDNMYGSNHCLLELNTEITSCHIDMPSTSRYTPSMSHQENVPDMYHEPLLESDPMCFGEQRGNSFDNLDNPHVDQGSTSGYSSQEEECEISTLISSQYLPRTEASNSESSLKSGTDLTHEDSESSNIMDEFPDSFLHWVYGDTFFR